MDLALNLGMTVAQIENEMTAVELDLWQRHAARFALPMRRMELYLAQIAMKISQVMGGNIEAQLSDFMFDPSEDEVEGAAAGDPEKAKDAAVVYFNFAPRGSKVKE